MSEPIENYRGNEGMFVQVSKMALQRMSELDCPHLIIAFDHEFGKVYVVTSKFKDMKQEQREAVAQTTYHAILNAV